MLSNTDFFSSFLEEVQKDASIGESLKQAEQDYNIKAYNISEITCEEAMKLYMSIYAKFYKGNHHMKSSNWFQNELRLFVWIVICYTHLKKKKLEHFDFEDWAYFQKIFDRKDSKLFQYQCHCFYLENKGKNWEREEQNLLKQVMSTYTAKNSKVKWNEISKQLFQFSNKQFLRTPKQCRERWNNHLDPSKVKGMWRREQYIKMFEFVRQHGKKWASLVKELNNVRNQHSIKNKFNSMVKRHKKSIGEKGIKQPKNEQELYTEIIEKIRSAIQNEKNCRSRSQIDFELDDYEEVKPIKRVVSFEKKTSNYAEKLMQKLMNFGGPNQTAKKRETVKLQISKPEKAQPLKVQQPKNPAANEPVSEWSQFDDDQSIGSSEMSNEHEDESYREQNKFIEKISNESLKNMHRRPQSEQSIKLDSKVIPDELRRKNLNEIAPTTIRLPIELVSQVSSSNIAGSNQQ